MKPFRVPLRVVFYKEDDLWVAHSLEFDLCGSGVSQDDALKSLGELIAIQIRASVEHDNLRNLFTPADSDVFAKFYAGADKQAVGEFRLTMDQISVEPGEYREYLDDLMDPNSEFAHA